MSNRVQGTLVHCPFTALHSESKQARRGQNSPSSTSTKLSDSTGGEKESSQGNDSLRLMTNGVDLFAAQTNEQNVINSCGLERCSVRKVWL